MNKPPKTWSNTSNWNSGINNFSFGILAWNLITLLILESEPISLGKVLTESKFCPLVAETLIEFKSKLINGFLF